MNTTRRFWEKISLVLMFLIPIIIFFALRIFISVWIAGIIAFALIVWLVWVSVFHVGSFLGHASVGLIKSNLIAYFRIRNKGETHPEALEGVIRTRYPFSETNRNIVWSLFSSEGVHDTQENEVKSLVYCIFLFECGSFPSEKTLSNVRALINKKYAELVLIYPTVNN